MAVKIRLARRGRKKNALYDVVVSDARAPRDGRFIEKIGTYNPNTNPATIQLDEERALRWLLNGAQPTDTVRAMLSYRGVLFKKHLQIGVIKGAISQEQADEKYNTWLNQKQSQIQNKVDRLADARAAEDKARLEAEAKVKEARAEAIRKKQEESAAQKETTEVVSEENNTTEENPTQE
ncbi:MAG: 30S ribosomal protein S16 [Cytophagales bacterium]|nr:MAG: 30S ribosomal protein S16 [Cytophagales bacterium]